MSGTTVAVAVVIAAAALLVVGFVVVQLVPLRNGTLRQRPVTPSLRITAALGVALVAAVLIGELFSTETDASSLALAGQQRYVSAPFVYGAFALIALTTTRRFAPRWPVWVVGLLIVVLLSTLFSPLAGPRFTLATLIQGVVLLGGTALFAICGLLDADWSRSHRDRFLRLLLGAGAVTGLLGLSTGVFSALVVPAGAALVYLARERVRLWPVLAVVGVVVLVRAVTANLESVNPSDAFTGQLLVAAGVLGLAALPRRWRLPLVVIAAVGAVVVASGSVVPGLFLGRGADLADVTLAQRAYETQQVVRQAGANPFPLLFGAGPGATVDLSQSPDAGTLSSSGRVLASVPSVHLLTSHVLMKGGLLGLAWLAVFLAAVAATALRVLRRDRPDLFDLILLTFVVCGVVQAVPAATFLFSNPLPALLLAILWVRHQQEQYGDLTRSPGLRGAFDPRSTRPRTGPRLPRPMPARGAVSARDLRE